MQKQSRSLLFLYLHSNKNKLNIINLSHNFWDLLQTRKEWWDAAIKILFKLKLIKKYQNDPRVYQLFAFEDEFSGEALMS